MNDFRLLLQGYQDYLCRVGARNRGAWLPCLRVKTSPLSASKVSIARRLENQPLD